MTLLSMLIAALLGQAHAASDTFTSTNTSTYTLTATVTTTSTSTPTVSGTITITKTSTPTSTYSSTRTATASRTTTATASSTRTHTITRTQTFTVTSSPTRTRTTTATRTQSASGSKTATVTVSSTSTPTITRTATTTSTATRTPTASSTSLTPVATFTPLVANCATDMQQAICDLDTAARRVIDGAASFHVTGAGGAPGSGGTIVNTDLLVPSGSTADYTPASTAYEVDANVWLGGVGCILYGAVGTTDTGHGSQLCGGPPIPLYTHAAIRFANPQISGVSVHLVEFRP